MFGGDVTDDGEGHAFLKFKDTVTLVNSVMLGWKHIDRTREGAVIALRIISRVVFDGPCGGTARCPDLSSSTLGSGRLRWHCAFF